MRTLLATLLVLIVDVTGLPKGFIPQLDYLCNNNVGYTGVPWDCTGYIQCVHNRAAWLNCARGLEYDMKRNQCVWKKGRCQNLDAIVINECPKYPTMLFPHPKNCARFYDCKEKLPKPPLTKYNQECPYPKLFDDTSQECLPRDQVVCGTRKIPKDKCSYLLECQENECTGKPDGKNPVTSETFGAKYIVCANEKVLAREMCNVRDGEVFDPVTKLCTAKKEESVMKRCENKTLRFEDPDSCHRYYDCSSEEVTPPLTNYQKECAYRQLYDAETNNCLPFDDVTCGKRNKKTEPCDYPIGRCDGGTCIPCDANCTGKLDGVNQYMGHNSKYLTCKNGLTLAIKNCPHGYEYNPGMGECSPNIALNKPTMMSSGNQSKFPLSVDGDDNTVITECSSTDTGDAKQWWQVDLQASYSIKSVTITNVEGQDGMYVNDLIVETFDTDPQTSGIATSCANVDGTIVSAATVTVSCTQEVKGRFVRISRKEGTNPDKKPLVLCEVRVDGWSNCSCQGEIQALKDQIDAINVSKAMPTIGPETPKDDGKAIAEVKTQILSLNKTIQTVATGNYALAQLVNSNSVNISSAEDKITNIIENVKQAMTVADDKLGKLSKTVDKNTLLIPKSSDLEKCYRLVDKVTQMEIQMGHLQCGDPLSFDDLSLLKTSVSDGHLTATYICKNNSEFYCGNVAKCSNRTWEYDTNRICDPRQEVVQNKVSDFTMPVGCAFGVGTKVVMVIDSTGSNSMEVEFRNEVAQTGLLQFRVVFTYDRVQCNLIDGVTPESMEYLTFFPENGGVFEITFSFNSKTTQVSVNGTEMCELTNTFVPTNTANLNIKGTKPMNILEIDFDYGNERDAAIPAPRPPASSPLP